MKKQIRFIVVFLIFASCSDSHEADISELKKNKQLYPLKDLKYTYKKDVFGEHFLWKDVSYTNYSHKDLFEESVILEIELPQDSIKEILYPDSLTVWRFLENELKNNSSIHIVGQLLKFNTLRIYMYTYPRSGVFFKIRELKIGLKATYTIDHEWKQYSELLKTE